MSSDSQKSLPLPEELRDELEALGQEAPPDEREFSARLHRRLAAAGPPPAPSWLERVQAVAGDLFQELAQKRGLYTGAVLGALATATAFLLLSGGRPLRDGAPSLSPEEEAAEVETAGSRARLEPGERKALRAVGDRRPTRDRLGEDIGAERPERPRLHLELPLPH
jgi:hypothetical protein